jgi:WD40 repeat protein/energy-coupling factor transporter ATP-binding protein EcfA2
MNPQDAHFNPFPGLRPFQIEEKYLFFGREEQTAELLTRLRKTRFLAVVGVSGSGKSSLVRAGLLPELHGGTMATAGSSWEVAVMRPGGDPLTNLSEALIEADIHDAGEEHIHSHVRASLARSGMGLVEAIKQGNLAENTNLLLVVDQFEEIFRFRRMSGLSEEEAGHFITLLLEASEQIDLPIYVVLTMRSDFLGDCAQFRGLAESVNEGEYLIPRLNRNQRRQAIEGPVAVGQREITSRLVQRLLNDIGDDPDQLPILQHALMRTWDHWDESGANGPLDLGHYQATGGMDEALSRHADEVHAELPDDEHRWISEKLFKALTEKVDQNRGIRRPMQFRELCQIIEKDEDKIRTVVDAFRRQGRTFLMPSGEDDITKKTVIDISHESLMRAWRRLRDWVDDEAQSAKIYRRLADTSSLYQEGKAGFYRDPDLQIALSWRDETKPNKSWADHYFAGFDEAMAFLDQSHEEAGREEREREEARQRELAQAQALAKAQQERAETEKLRAEEQARAASRLRKMLAGLAVATAAAIVFLIVAVLAKRAVDAKVLELAKRSIATGDALTAEGETLRALPWYADAADLAKGDRDLQQAYQWKLVQKIEQAPRLTGKLFREHNVSCVGFTPDGKRYFVAEWAGWNTASDIGIYGTETGNLIKSQTLPWGISIAEYSKDGSLLFVKGGERTIKVFDAVQGTVLHTFDKHRGWVGHQLDATGDNSLLAVPVRGAQNGIALWDMETGKEKYPILKTNQGCNAAAFSHDGRFLIGTTGGNFRGNGNAGAVYVWELRANQNPELRHRINIGRPVHSVRFSPDGDSFAFACGSLDGTNSPFFARVFDADTGQPISERMEHGGGVFFVEFSPDAKWVLTASIDGTARTWEANTGTPVSTPMTHEDRLYHATFSPDGAFVATASADNTARVWDAATGRPVTAPLLHLDQVDGVSFDPTSRNVITASRDHTARIYQLPLERQSLTGKASQSTTGFGGHAFKAVDGNKDGHYFNAQSVTHTVSRDPNPWWQLELFKENKISKIVIWNRTDSNLRIRLVNFRVRLLDELGRQVWAKDYLTEAGAKAPNPELEINLPDRIFAKKIRIEKIGTDSQNQKILSLAEVEVFGPFGSKNRNKSIDDLRKYSQIASASEISDEGSLEALSRKKLKHNWESIQSASLIEPSINDSNIWHAQRARQLFQAKQWSGFFYHHSRMVKSDRQKADFIAMEADAHAELANWNESLNLHLKAVSMSPGNVKVLSGCLALCAQLDHLSKGQKLLDGVIDSYAGNQSSLRELASQAITNPKLFKDISIPLGWMNTQYEKRPGYIDLGDSEALRLTDAITLEGWFRYKSGVGLFAKGGPFMDDGYGFTVAGSFLRFELQNTQTQEKTMSDGPMPQDREWVHLAATWDINTSQVIHYVDGIRQDQVGYFNGPIGVSDQHLNLGRNERWGNRYCASGFSEFRIWNRARTGEEIRASMNIRLKGDELGLVGYWPFDKDTGTVAKSGLAGEIDGVIVNPNWRTTNALPFSDETYFCEVSFGSFLLWESLTLQGGLQYRNGKPEEAVKTLESARIGGAKRPPDMLKQDDGFDLQWLLLAQCYYQLGEREKAASFLKLANERITDKALSEMNWRERFQRRALLKETREMLGKDSSQSN